MLFFWWERWNVPILTQSENWALWYHAMSAILQLRSNPHPVRKLGAMQRKISDRPEWLVPILTQSENWALLIHKWLLDNQRLVPILTQSENWALFPFLMVITPRSLFQSSPSPKTGRYINISSNHKCEQVPILTQSENWALFSTANQQAYYQVCEQVPILTQSENWALSR